MKSKETWGKAMKGDKETRGRQRGVTETVTARDHPKHRQKPNQTKDNKAWKINWGVGKPQW